MFFFFAFIGSNFFFFFFNVNIGDDFSRDRYNGIIDGVDHG